MGDKFDYKDGMNSYGAVRSLLAKYEIRHTRPCELNLHFKFSNGHDFKQMTEFEEGINGQNTPPILKIYSDAFKSQGLRNPIWSNYHHFSYDDAKETLSVTVDGITILID